MGEQIPLDSSLRADEPARDDARNDGTIEVAPDIAYRRLAIVNVVFFGRPGAGDRGWVLIDAGLFGTKHFITSAAAARFGEGARPAAIVLTHGHFDHVGLLEDLATEWDVPVYAHPLEHPYLNGTACYPPPDPSVGGGLVALSSSLFPRAPVNVSERLRTLPDDGTVPHMPGWRWVHTPGHSPGHVSLFRESDRSMIVGDAFVTTRQESIYAAVTQAEELHGPPMYYTPDWEEAGTSVRRLASMAPELVVTGHGRALRGQGMREGLNLLAQDFELIAVPSQGRYVSEPATAAEGSAYVRDHHRPSYGRAGSGTSGKLQRSSVSNVAAATGQDIGNIALAALITGSIASVVTTVTLVSLARAEGKGELQPVNSTSHWLHGEEAARVRGADAAHTAIGYATHHASALFWAVPFEWWRSRSPDRSASRIARDASVMAAIAAAVDYGMVPKRLTPGWENVLSKRSIAVTYVALAAGLALGALVNQHWRRKRGFTD